MLRCLGVIKMKKIIVMISLVAALVLSGCQTIEIKIGNQETIVGSSNTITKSLGFANFDSLKASHQFDVTVLYGESFDLEVTYSEEVEDMLEISTRSNTLNIGLSNDYNYQNVTVKAVITMPQLNKMKGSGASSFDVDEEMIYADNVTIELSGASNVEALVSTKLIDVSISGASMVYLSGQADVADFDLSGSSIISAEKFEAKELELDASGSSSVNINVSDSIEASLSGGSTLRYSGNAKIKDEDTSGSSKIIKQ